MLTLKKSKYKEQDFRFLFSLLLSGSAQMRQTRQCKTASPLCETCPSKTACDDVTRLLGYLANNITPEIIAETVDSITKV